MSTKILRPDILAAYALAVLVYALAIYVAGTIDHLLASRLVLLLAAASVFLVTAATFRWGRLSGYPVLSEGKRFSLEFLLRNLAMTVFALVMLAILGSPVWGIVFWLIARR
jgi:membrane protease YdiL (CAAX protease family)